jgi:hypothetical protein
VHKTDYRIIYQILAQAYDTTNSDFRFVLRNILSRGAEEANYLSFQFEGEDGEEFRLIKNRLEGVISDLPQLLDGDGNVLHQHRAAVREAITLARYLIAIERDQTAGQLDMLSERLKDRRCHKRRCELMAA